MRETVIETKVVKYAREQGVFAHKMQGDRGVPDYMFLYKGITFFIEFKAPNQKPRKYQQYIHEQIREHYFEVYVVDNVRVGMNIIDNLVIMNVGNQQPVQT